VAVFGALSPHLKIPFPAAGLEREVWPRFAPVIPDLGPALQLFPIESKRLKLAAPFSRRITESLDANAAGQATFYTDDFARLRWSDALGAAADWSQFESHRRIARAKIQPEFPTAAFFARP
jgi:hypothetical protein